MTTQLTTVRRNHHGKNRFLKDYAVRIVRGAPKIKFTWTPDRAEARQMDPTLAAALYRECTSFTRRIA